MVAPLAVLGLVIDDAVLDLDLADRVVALEVRRVVLCVPEAELDGAEQRQARRRRRARFVTRVRHTSRVSPSGTKYRVSTRIPARLEAIIV